MQLRMLILYDENVCENMLLYSNLETTKSKRGIELINCDDHQKLITKMKKNYEDYRPDVTHQV